MRLPKISHHTIGTISLLLLAVTLPFELEKPLLSAGPLQITNLELAVGFVLLAAFLSWHTGRAAAFQPAVPILWIGLLALFAAVLLLSAVLTPEHRLNAFKAALRTLSGLALALAAARLTRKTRRFHQATVALLVGGAVAVLIGLVEMQSGTTLDWLTVFRGQPTVAGPFLRLSGPFNHANEASMYIEATLPLLLAWGWLTWQNRAPYKLIPIILIGLIFLYATILTYSRSGFATLLLTSLLLVGLLWWRRPTAVRQFTMPWLLILPAITLLIGLMFWLDPIFRLRLSSEGDNEWYLVDYTVPEQLEIKAAATEEVTIEIANQGSLTWRSDGPTPINLGARWYRQPGNVRSSVELRWSLEEIVRPGERLSLTIPVQAPPEPGSYTLEWDLVHEQVIWFSMKNGQQIHSQVTVLDNPNPTAATIQIQPESFNQSRPLARPVPDRRTLWRIAGQQFLERPLLGIGLDNFRLTYGRYLGEGAWKEAIHTNNWYIETLVSTGILGSLAFLGWLGLLVLDLLVRLRRPAVTIWQVALAGSLLAYMIHGLLDYFLLFNSTGLLFWLLVGLWLGRRTGALQEEAI